MEIGLLSLFPSSLPPASCRDIPVYLPKASNKVAHRLIIFNLIEGIELCVLCGPDPPLSTVQNVAESFWSGMVESLRSCTHVFPRCVPLSLNLDPSILAFSLVNLDTRRSVTSLKPSTVPDTLRTALSPGVAVCYTPLHLLPLHSPHLYSSIMSIALLHTQDLGILLASFL